MKKYARLLNSVVQLILHGSSPPSPILGGYLKISGQNNWRGTEQKIKFGGGPKILGGAVNPNDVTVVELKYILLC